MITSLPLLQDVRVASPCHASWDEMAAIDGERVKFCGGCKKNVYNLSARSQGEAEGLLRKHEGHLCVRYYQRSDGTVLSGDCSVGAQAIRMALVRRSVVAAGLFAMLFSAMAAVNIRETKPIASPESVGLEISLSPIIAVEPPVIEKTAPTPEPRMPIMGAVAMPSAEPPVRAEMGKPVMGDSTYPVYTEEKIKNIPDIPFENQAVKSEKDSTDESILKPHND